VTDEALPSIRVDKWLWYARFLKSRSIASRFVSDGNLRIDGERSTKPSRAVKPGEVLTFPQGQHIRVIKILEIGTRRGPAPEAQALYEDLSPPERQPRVEEIRTGPRPTKRNRREMDQLRDREN
jgi:ribosome-associated heat shock protein Hsp15